MVFNTKYKVNDTIICIKDLILFDTLILSKGNLYTIRTVRLLKCNTLYGDEYHTYYEVYHDEFNKLPNFYGTFISNEIFYDKTPLKSPILSIGGSGMKSVGNIDEYFKGQQEIRKQKLLKINESL